MMDEHGARSSGEEGSDRTLWDLLRDLAGLARAHARLTEDLVRLLERQVGAEAGPLEPLEEQHPRAASDPRPEAPPMPTAQPVETERSEPTAELEPVAEAPVPEASAPDAASAGMVSDPEPVAEPQASPSSSEIEVVDSVESGAETSEEVEGQVPPDVTVLTLESGDTRVGVRWDQVIRVGTLDAPNPPEEIEMEGGRIPLVSLGRLLHGVSREEKCYVVIENEGERASIACERALGIGSLGSLARHDPEASIQVLRVPMLQAFAHAPSNGGGSGTENPPVPTPAEIEAEKRDRHGPLRALVAVRYLPARVAICRHLRSKGWQVGEAAGLEAATVSLDLGRWDLFFLEASGNGEQSETEQTLMRRVDERGVPVVRVGSRISGYPGQEAPSLMFPFSETELESIIDRMSRPDDID